MSKITSSLAALAVSMTRLFGAEPAVPLAADAATLIGAKTTTWKSPVLDLRHKDGSTKKGVLVVEFLPFSGGVRTVPTQAAAQLSLATPTVGVPGLATFSTSIGDASPQRDVRLQEKEGARTITFVRAIETIPNQTPATERLLNEIYSSSFSYELKKDALVLKGFSPEGTTWGPVEFVAPQREITFTPAKP